MTPSQGQSIDHPTGATDVVLRMTEYPSMPYPGMILEPTAEWPWPDLTLSHFAPTPDGNLLGTVSSAHAHAVLDTAGEHSFIATGLDGRNYLIRVRPLLPDQLP